MTSSRRRDFLLAAAALAAAPVLHAQTGKSVRSAKPPRIFIVTWRGETAVEKGFREYWKIHRADAEFIARDAGQNRARLAEFEAEILREKPDLVYTWGTPPTVGLAGTIDKPHAVIGKTIPLVFAAVTDPGVMIAGHLPPSSSVTGVRLAAAACITWRPTLGLPV